MKKFSLLLCIVCAFVFAVQANADQGKLKALLVDGQNNHNWREVSPVLKKDLEESGRFTVDVATSPDHGQDMSNFKPNFAAYDVVVMNYNGDSWCEETKKAFVDYVSNGGGLVIVHAANNSFGDWKEYNDMIAIGGWGGRNRNTGPLLYWKDGKAVIDNETNGPAGNHGRQHEYPVEVREPNHPIVKGLPLKFMHGTDELYEQLRGPAQNVTILATSFATPEMGGCGRHEPQLMVIPYGKGRVFHLAMGDNARACRCVAFIVCLQRGTEWAATGEVTIPVPADMPTADKSVTRD